MNTVQNPAPPTGGRWFAPPEATVVYLVLLVSSLVTFSGFRLAFYFLYRGFFSGVPEGRILAGFVRGLRFDLSTLAAMMGPPFLLFHLLPAGWRRSRPGLVVLVLALPAYWLAFFLFFADLHYYAEAGRRLSYEVFTLSHDVTATVGMILQYPKSLAAWVTLCVVYSWAWLTVARAVPRRISSPGGAVRGGLWFLAFVAFSIISGRGGLQVKPLRPSYAFADDNLILGHLALNPAFTVAHTIYQGETPVPRYYPEREALATVRGLLLQPPSAFPDPRFPMMHETPGGAAVSRTRPNIVVILEESWAGKFIGALGRKDSLTPHFDRLARDGILFTNFYANGQRSIEGMACLCCALPTFRDTILIGGSLEQNSLQCVGQAFKTAGYHTLFIHGARTGSFGFDAFSRRAGFDRYIGMEDFSLTKDEYDPFWGVYDGVALMKVNRELRRLKEPFLALWFSLSAHSPYNLPPGTPRPYPKDLPDGELWNTILYSDDALGKFFDTAKKEKYFANTIFVILADHSSGTTFSNMRERFWIPCLIYAPGLLAPRRIDEVGSQLDILPTLLDLAGIRTEAHAFGRSLFDRPGAPREAFLDSVSIYGWIRDRLFLVSDQQKPLALYDYGVDPLEKHDLLRERTADTGEMTRELQSFVQVSKTLILGNRLFPPPYLRSPSLVTTLGSGTRKDR